MGPMPVPPLALEELLAESSWLRCLARRLVAGEDAAEDLVQATWLAALRHPPADGPARPWLARVARRLAANFRRGEARRRTHEAAAPAAEPVDPRTAAEVLDTQRVLVEAVLRLPEPLRTTVVLRYVQGLDSQAIGRRQGTPAGTVRWRLKQALELLRADLDRRFGGERERWLTAFAPWIGAPGALATVATTSPLAKTGVGAGLVLGGLLGAFVVYTLVGGAGRERQRATHVAHSASPEAAQTPVALRAAIAPVPDGLVESAPTATRESTPRVGPRAPPRKAPVRGRLWIKGTTDPLDELLTLHLRSGDLAVKERVVTAPDGTFVSAAAFPRGVVLATVLRPSGTVADELETFFEPAAGEEWNLAVRWPTFVSFRVVDRAGDPLAGVHVTLAGETPADEEAVSETRKPGEVRIEGLSPGRYVLALRRGFAHGERRILVARGPNELGELELRAAGGGEIRGEMRCARGENTGTVLLLDLDGTLLARASTIERGRPGVFEFVFADVPPGGYRLVPLAYDGRRYEPESMRVSPPETGLVFEASGTRPAFEVQWPEDVESGSTFVRFHGRWFFEQGFSRADVERWFVLAEGRRPASGDPPASGPVVPRLEPGWGHALLFVEVGADPAFPHGSGIAGNPLAGVEVLADGRPVATSDASGLALLSLEAEPEVLAFHKPGWLVQARDLGDWTTVVTMRRD